MLSICYQLYYNSYCGCCFFIVSSHRLFPLLTNGPAVPPVLMTTKITLQTENVTDFGCSWTFFSSYLSSTSWAFLHLQALSYLPVTSAQTSVEPVVIPLWFPLPLLQWSQELTPELLRSLTAQTETSWRPQSNALGSEILVAPTASLLQLEYCEYFGPDKQELGFAGCCFLFCFFFKSETHRVFVFLNHRFLGIFAPSKIWKSVACSTNRERFWVVQRCSCRPKDLIPWWK